MKITATLRQPPRARRAVSLQRIRDRGRCRSRTVERFKRELGDELERRLLLRAHRRCARRRRDALERAVRRVWGATL